MAIRIRRHVAINEKGRANDGAASISLTHACGMRDNLLTLFAYFTMKRATSPAELRKK